MLSRKPSSHHPQDSLNQDELELWQKSKELIQRQNELSQQIRHKEDDATLPPLEDIHDVKRSSEYEISSSRGEIKNLRKELGRNYLLMFFFLLATLLTSWWIWTSL